MKPTDESIAQASRRAARVSAIGAVLVFASLIYSAFRIASVEEQIEFKQAMLDAVSDTLELESKRWLKLQSEVEELRLMQHGLLTFLSTIVDDSKVRLIDPDVDWMHVQTAIDTTHGARRQAMLAAVLLAWKDIPFAMGSSRPDAGFDSPRFLSYVLERSGVKVTPKPNERMSDALMRVCTRVDAPLPGDLVFFRGQVGAFGLLYLGGDVQSGTAIGIGTLQATEPLQVMLLKHVNTQYFPLIGFFRVPYPLALAVTSE